MHCTTIHGTTTGTPVWTIVLLLLFNYSLLFAKPDSGDKTTRLYLRTSSLYDFNGDTLYIEKETIYQTFKDIRYTAAGIGMQLALPANNLFGLDLSLYYSFVQLPGVDYFTFTRIEQVDYSMEYYSDMGRIYGHTLVLEVVPKVTKNKLDIGIGTTFRFFLQKRRGISVKEYHVGPPQKVSAYTRYHTWIDNSFLTLQAAYSFRKIRVGVMGEPFKGRAGIALAYQLVTWK